MKQGKSPTRVQKQWITAKGLNASDWLVVCWTNTRVTLQHRTTSEVKDFEL